MSSLMFSQGWIGFLFLLALISPQEKYSFVFSVASSSYLLLFGLYTIIKQEKLYRYTFFFLLFFLWCAFLTLLYVFRSDKSTHGFLMYWVTFGPTLIWFAFGGCLSDVHINRIYCFIKLFVYAQVPIVLYQGWLFGLERGDHCKGTLPNAHIIGFFLYMVTFIECIYRKKSVSLGFIIIVSALLFTAWLTDSNTFFIALLVSIGVAFIVAGNVRYRYVLVGVFPMVLGVHFLISTYGHLLVVASEIPKVKGYLTLGELFDDGPENLIFGLGPGQYSSRASVILAPSEIVAKPRGNVLPITDYSSHFEHFLADLYSPQYYESIEKAGHTGTFYTPFSGVLSFISETGWVGIALLFTAISLLTIRSQSLDERFSFKNKVLFFFISILAIYDNWLEYPAIGLTLALLLHYSIKRKEVVCG